jgi:hypothetical protein
MMAVNVGMSRCAIVSRQLELNKAASDVASRPYLDHDYRGQLHELDEINAESAGARAHLHVRLPKEGVVADSVHCV